MIFYRFLSLILALTFSLAILTPANAITKVPAGNRNAKQPAIPYGSIKRTRSGKGTFDKKYVKIKTMLGRNKKLIKKIKKAARAYGIEPIHIIGALVGEHTYNVDALDRMQTYYVKALAYLGSDLTFKYGKEKVTKFVARGQFAKCAKFSNSYDLWACREGVWISTFKGKNVDGISWPNDRFGRVFFQPLYAGQTFGLGQLNPLTALRVTDLVASKTRSRKLNPKRAPEVYKEIMDPDSTLNYMAAVIKTSIDAYRNTAGMDISNNPGLTATLYNLGDVRNRAAKLAAINRKRKKAGKKPQLPQENYYGWLVNDKEIELRKLL